MRSALALLRREPDFRRTFVAALVSGGGDWFALIPLLVLLHDQTGGGLAGGLVLAADTAVFALLSPYAGTVADRLDRRRIMVGCELASAALVLLLLAVRSAGTTWVAVLAIGGIAAAKAFTEPAAVAAQPNLVTPGDLPLASIMNGTAWGSMLAVGAALGGLSAAAFGARACFLIDAASFVLSAALLTRCRTPFQEQRAAGPRPGFRADVREAVAFARSDHRVLALLAAKPGVGFANGALVLFPLLASDVFGVGAVGLGLLYAARGLGALLGPLLLGRRGRDPDSLLWLVGGCIASCGACYLGVAAAPAFSIALVLVALAHVGGGANWTSSSYGLAVLVPDRVRARVSSADLMLCSLVIAANQGAAGVLSQLVSTRLLVAVFGAATVGYAACWLLATRGLRRPAAVRA